jgi:hypothetical protein
MSTLSIIDSTGDTRIQWDKSNADEVQAARIAFAAQRAKGWPAFRVNKAGDKGEQIDAFDPAAERIIFIPQMIGG